MKTPCVNDSIYQIQDDRKVRIGSISKIYEKTWGKGGRIHSIETTSTQLVKYYKYKFIETPLILVWCVSRKEWINKLDPSQIFYIN